MRFNADDDVFHGKLEGIDDLVSYEGTTVVELKKNFRNAVDDYIVLCAEAGKNPVKSCKGTFNVRIPAELHQAAMRRAALQGVSLNQIVKTALEREVGGAGTAARTCDKMQEPVLTFESRYFIADSLRKFPVCEMRVGLCN